MKNDVKLVMIEWEDSAQPVAAWQFLSSVPKPRAIRCVSVGWLIKDGKRVKALAPNMGNIDCVESFQVSGVMQIPTSCIIAMHDIAEPDV